jgi:hypothetical protein
MKSPAVLIFALLMLSPQITIGQKNAIWAGAGIQTSKMDDMKYLQGLILGSYPVEGKVISAFPAYTMGSFGFVHQLYPSIRIGAGYSFAATGAKSNYTDYTGYITTLFDAKSHRGGIFGTYSVIGGDWFELSLLGRLEIKYTMLDISTSLYALGASGNNNNSYGSWSPGVEAGVEFLIHLKKYSFGLEGGYEADVPGKLSRRENKEQLFDPNDLERVLTSDWSGWYTQVKFLLWLDF